MNGKDKELNKYGYSLPTYKCEICGWTFMGGAEPIDSCVMCDAIPDNDPDDGSWVGR